MIYDLLAIICFIIVGIINRKIKKAKKEEEGVSADLDVKECKPISAYLPQLQEIFSKPKIICGYNVSFDLKFIHAAGIKTNAPGIIDVMKRFDDEKHGHNKWFKLEEAARN